MAIKKTVQHVQLLRNSGLTSTHTAASDAVKAHVASSTTIEDGTVLLNRYGSGNNVKTVAAFVYKNGDTKTTTVFDVEDIENKISSASGNTDASVKAVDAKLGTGVTSANTVTAQLQKLSGSTADTSGSTSVAGAKKYADEKVSAATSSLTIISGETTGGNTDAFLKKYTIKQGGKDVITIDIPKDLVVTSGSVVKGTWSGEKFTENTSGNGTALKLVIANQTNPVYINTLDLVKDHTGGNGITISDTNVISINIDTASESYLKVDEHGLKISGVKADISGASASTVSALIGTDSDTADKNTIKGVKAAINAEASTARAAEKENADAIALLNSGDTAQGSVAKAVKDAKTALIGDAAEEYNTLGKLEDKIQELDKKAASAHTEVNSKSTGHVTVSVADSSDKTHKVVTVSENDIASASALTKEISDARAAEKKITPIAGEGIAVSTADNGSTISIDLSGVTIDCGEY